MGALAEKKGLITNCWLGFMDVNDQKGKYELNQSEKSFGTAKSYEIKMKSNKEAVQGDE